MQKRVTIREVAEAVGVTPGTVSNALNGKGRVDPETAAVIRRTAEAMKYEASSAARNLRGGRTGLIGVMHSASPTHKVSLTDLDHFIRLVAGASEVAAARGCNLVLMLAAADDVWRIRTDGIIMVDPVTDDALLRSLRQSGLPVVTSGRDTAQPAGNGSWVDNDNDLATRLVLDHLYKQGARRIALITAQSFYSYSHDTIESYHCWCRERGQEPLVREADGTINEAVSYAITNDLLAIPSPPDAIHCVTDRHAIGALMAAQAKGLKVPGDLLLSAGTDSDAARFGEPAITALNINPGQMGRHAAELLLDQLQGHRVKENVIIPVNIVERASTLRTVSRPDVRLR